MSGLPLFVRIAPASSGGCAETVPVELDGISATVGDLRGALPDGWTGTFSYQGRALEESESLADAGICAEAVVDALTWFRAPAEGLLPEEQPLKGVLAQLAEMHGVRSVDWEGAGRDTIEGTWYYARGNHYTISRQDGKLTFDESGRKGVLEPVAAGEAPHDFQAQYKAEISSAGTLYIRHRHWMESLWVAADDGPRGKNLCFADADWARKLQTVLHCGAAVHDISATVITVPEGRLEADEEAWYIATSGSVAPVHVMRSTTSQFSPRGSAWVAILLPQHQVLLSDVIIRQDSVHKETWFKEPWLEVVLAGAEAFNNPPDCREAEGREQLRARVAEEGTTWQRIPTEESSCMEKLRLRVTGERPMVRAVRMHSTSGFAMHTIELFGSFCGVTT
eukprot:TRINITY_DN3934_c0_g1_i2.p1 TRINITY_DN3934_c0_g1~~TRINITY_DN3934_c0_g1_i2.p1  ORF type:complete len:393 (+),score=62.00 TRINITY_DN3934_c0_g1_i2:105-1283(+)